jgi:hypothetical protein
MKGYAMLDWVEKWPHWLQIVWFCYITFHDLIQWVVLALIGLTVWGRRKRQRNIEALAAEIQHIHDEVHKHIEEDSFFHENLGQRGMSRGKDVEPTE